MSDNRHITKFFEDFSGLFKRHHVAYFLKTQRSLFLENIDESFSRQVYFAGSNEVKWVPLAEGTVYKRIKRNTWRGQEHSILKDTPTYDRPRRYYSQRADVLSIVPTVTTRP